MPSAIVYGKQSRLPSNVYTLLDISRWAADPMKLKNTLLVAAFSLITTIIAESGANIPITTLPLNITAPGTYVLKGNLSYLGTDGTPAIAIANNITGTVVVDLNGFTITGGGETGYNNLSFGVSIGYYNVTATNAYPIFIRNGTLSNFTIGVDGDQGGRSSLQNITLNKLPIIRPPGGEGHSTSAIFVIATSSTVSNCTLSHYDSGIVLVGSGTTGNTCINNEFTFVGNPFSNGGDSVVIRIPVIIQTLESRE
jgi:hypothetical protein